MPVNKSSVLKIAVTALVVMILFFLYFYYQMHSVIVNRVNINNINPDNSVNYRYMFREEIEKEKHADEIREAKEFK